MYKLYEMLIDVGMKSFTSWFIKVKLIEYDKLILLPVPKQSKYILLI